MFLRAILFLLPLVAFGFLFSSKTKFQMPKHADGVKVADYADHDLPPVKLNQRVIDLMSAMHFDALLQDTPDELRPASLILFQGFKTCPNADSQIGYTKLAETKLPSRERLMICSYDIDANPKRAWFRFTPEMDLQKRFGATECGSIAFVPRHSDCNGFTEWCTKKTDDPKTTRVGCENFVDKCAKHVEFWDKQTPLYEWVTKLVKREGEPHISPVFGSYKDQNRWLLSRDETTTDNELRNYYLVEAFPAFTPLGFLPMPIPEEMNKWILDFWNRRKHGRVTESWYSGSTQMDFHEVPTSFVSMDQESRMRDRFANEIIKPIVEKWSGIAPLELTSFYGIREYKDNILRGHIDRIDTHVLSVTFSLGKLNNSDINQILSDAEADKQPKWPLEVIAFDGEIYRHEHPQHTMILYESSKLVHGRPYRNVGPAHLGAFCHFKPVNMNALQAEKWDDIARSARDNQERNSHHGTMRSSPVVEPKNPVYSKHRYGDKTGFRRSNGEQADDGNDDDADEKVFRVTFTNTHSSPLDLHWLSPGGQLMFQGTVGVKSSFEMSTYLGHKFVWTEEGSEKRMPKGLVEIEAGSRSYRYGAGASVV